jgi:SAM-dependent methyltransferase
MKILTDIFERIYVNNRWKNTETRSGRGSTIFHTQNIRKWLLILITERKITSILDVGCGDWNWMKTVHLDIPYIGCDIVPAIIETNKNLYARDGPRSRTFIIADAVEDDLPNADLVIVRDVIYHLSFININKLILNIKKCTPRYLLITNSLSATVNENIGDGGYRPISVFLPPLSFKNPLEQYSDCTEAKEEMVLFDINTFLLEKKQ